MTKAASGKAGDQKKSGQVGVAERKAYVADCIAVLRSVACCGASYSIIVDAVLRSVVTVVFQAKWKNTE